MQWGAFIAALNARLSQSTTGLNGAGTTVVVPLPALVHVPVDVYLDAIPRSMIAGVVLTGGNDISSRTMFARDDTEQQQQQQQRRQQDGLAVSTAEQLSEMRDEFESGLYHAALRLGVPVMGVCRGCQLIALLQHSNEDALMDGSSSSSKNDGNKDGSNGSSTEAGTGDIRGRPVYTLRPCPDRRLHVATTHRLVRAAATAMGQCEVPQWLSRFEGHRVNSYHNFAVVPAPRRESSTGAIPGLRPVLLSEQDGSIEALVGHDSGQGPRILGIMWHPERFQQQGPCELDLDMFIDFFRLGSK